MAGSGVIIPRLENGGGVIVGLGVDISEVDRIREAISRHGERFLKRVFTPAEIAYCNRHRNSAERFAGRFAAKEAAMKALGTGWSQGVRWVDIEVVRAVSGKPSLALHGTARRIGERLGMRSASLSITHSGNTAFAQVIFEN
jgi:holo-[acyl-carrier protein] synthase